MVKFTPRKQAFLFFALTYLLSWTLFGIGNATEMLPFILIGVWVPSLMGLLLTLLFFGRKGLGQYLKRFGRLQVAWYYWAALLLLPASIHFTGVSLWQWWDQGTIQPNILPLKYWPSAILPSILIAGLGEELGWRGFALPRLQRHFSPLTASLLLAIFHIFWHFPTYWLGQGIHNVPGIYMLAFGLPWTFLFTWIYNKSGGSLIFAVGFHAISNASLAIVRFMPLDSEVPITPELVTQTSLPAELGGPYLSVCFVYALVALAVILLGGFSKVHTDIP